MMIGNLLIIAAVVAALVIGLILYGLFAKDQTPMMGGGCTGDCSKCAMSCDEQEEKKK